MRLYITYLAIGLWALMLPIDMAWSLETQKGMGDHPKPTLSDEESEILTESIHAGVAYSLAGKNSHAIVAFERAIAILPEAETYSLIAQNYEHMGAREKAIQSYEEALALNSEFVPALNGLGRLFGANDDWRRSIDFFLGSLRIDPHQAEVWDGLGWAYLGLGAHHEAIPAFERSLAIEPNNAGVLAKLAFAAVGTGDALLLDDTLKQLDRINPSISRRIRQEFSRTPRGR
jgi:tetratricopeptide (TPR) repeat protein